MVSVVIEHHLDAVGPAVAIKLLHDDKIVAAFIRNVAVGFGVELR